MSSTQTRPGDWHLLGAEEALAALGSSASGLSAGEVQSRLEKFGPNALVEKGIKSVWRILWEQMTSIMVIILVIAAVVSLFLGEYIDAAAILAIVVLNAVLGVMQEYRAEKAMHALKQLAVPIVRVRRDGRVQEVSARELVPGDVVLLEAGSHVPADARLLEVASLRAQEATLTGESEPVEKTQERVQGAQGSRGPGSEPLNPRTLEPSDPASYGHSLILGRRACTNRSTIAPRPVFCSG